MRRWAAGAMLVTSVVLGVGPARAQATPAAPGGKTDGSFRCPPADASRDKVARATFDEAVQLEASDPEGALTRYQCASTLAMKPAIELRIGVVAERLHRDDLAIVHFERYLSLAGASAPDAASMRAHVKDLKAKREREAQAPTNVPVAGNDGTAASPVTGPEPAPTPSPSPERTWIGVGLVGLGVVLGAVGGGLLLDAKSKNDDVHALPPGTVWATDEAQGTYDAASRSQTIGIVCLVLAPAALIGGAVLLLTRTSSSSPATAGLARGVLRF